VSGRVLDQEARDEILRSQILPLMFPAGDSAEAPTLILLAGQPGAGKSMITGRLIADLGSALAVLNAEDLQAFHPNGFGSSRPNSAEDAQAMGRDTAVWVRECIRFAREHRRSLLLEGTFQDSNAAQGTAARFSDAGFQTRVVVAASRRAESLLSVTSRYLREVHSGGSARYSSREAHDAAFEATRTLVAAIESAASVDRLTVIGRDGRTVFDGRRTDWPEAFAGAVAALAAAQSTRMSRAAATQWLSELHHVTDFAASRRDLSRGVTELLVDLHEVSLREVIPELQVPADGKFASAMEQATAARLVSLRRSVQPAQPVDAAAPVRVPGGPERGGLSR